MANRNVKRLHDLEIDEISLVDRGANQHATVAIAKRYEESNMAVFDSEGVEVYQHELEDGDVVYAEDGTELVFVVEDGDGTSADLDEGYEYEAAEQGYEPELVGKAASPAMGVGRLGRAYMKGAEKLRNASPAARGGMILGGTAGAAGAAGYAGGRRGRVGKSLGDGVLETLSKALREGDRDEAVEGLLEYVEVVKRESDETRQALQAVLEAQQLGEYSELASQYGVPADPERLGRIMKSLGDVLHPDDFAEVDRVLSGAGEIYQELGTAGSGYTSDVMGQVEALAFQAVGKSDLSHEQAVVALFEANPAAYDEYVNETR